MKAVNIGKKESQKKLIKEIMELDAKNGLYGTLSELDKLAEETFKGDDATAFVQREIWKDGYKKAQVNLYTEEDIKKAFEAGHALGVYLADYKHDEIYQKFLQSLKKNKKQKK
jgi:hypothetical protein